MAMCKRTWPNTVGIELIRGSTRVPGASVIINAGGTEKRGAAVTLKGTCRAAVSLTAGAPLPALGAQTRETLPESLPESEQVRRAFAAEAPHLMSREPADENRTARARQDATVIKDERSSGKGRGDDGSPLQKEAMLGRDPDPVLHVDAL